MGLVPAPVAIERPATDPVVTSRLPLTALASRLPIRLVTVKLAKLEPVSVRSVLSASAAALTAMASGAVVAASVTEMALVPVVMVLVDAVSSAATMTVSAPVSAVANKSPAGGGAGGASSPGSVGTRLSVSARAWVGLGPAPVASERAAGHPGGA